MATERLSMRQTREILRQKWKRVSSPAPSSPSLPLIASRGPKLVPLSAKISGSSRGVNSLKLLGTDGGGPNESGCSRAEHSSGHRASEGQVCADGRTSDYRRLSGDILPGPPKRQSDNR